MSKKKNELPEEQRFYVEVMLAAKKYQAGLANGFLPDEKDPDGHWKIEPREGMRTAREDLRVRQFAPSESCVGVGGETPITPHLPSNYAKFLDFLVKNTRTRDRSGD